MKKSMIFYCLVVVLLTSCKNEVRVIEKLYQYKKTFNETHVVEFDIRLENLENFNKASRLIRTLLYNDKDFDEYAAYLESKFVEGLADYTDANKESYYNEIFSIVHHNDSYIIIENTYYYIYSGMAHGSYNTKFLIIDIAEEKILNVNDLVNPIPDDLLKELIEKEYEISNYLRVNIWPPETISINQDGIALIWNIYQIAPFSYGWIWIELPEEIADQYLTEKGKTIKSSR